MINLGGIYYIIDLDRYSQILTDEDDSETTIENETRTDYGSDGQQVQYSVTTREFEKPKVVDGPKYDILRMCLDVFFTYNDEIDDTLGFERALQTTTIPFKVAFNTLFNYGILIEVEE